MSDQHLSSPVSSTSPVAPQHQDPKEKARHVDILEFYGHSQFFYYWVIWVVSLLFAVITRLTAQEVTMNLPNAAKTKVLISTAPGLGLAFLILLIAVILFTSVNIRGVMAALVGTSFVIIGMVFNILGWWGPILRWLGNFNFFLSYHFYLFFGVTMGLFWFLIVFIFDRRHYIRFSPTQMTFVQEIGDGEKIFDTTGLVFDKQRDNFFQHFVLGFGSGDLKITTSGGQKDVIHFPNVLFISKRIADIHRIREQRGR